MTTPVLLFAAGLGTRMGALTQDRPKPLVEVAGKALIDHALTLVDGAALGRRVVNLHYKPQMIRDHLSGQDIAFSDETGQRLETGGGLRQAMALLGSDPVVTLNTDAVWRGSNPIHQLLQDWQPQMEALLLLVPRARAHGHMGKGDFRRAPDGRLERGTDTIYTGLQMVRTNTLPGIADPAFSMNLVWDQMAGRGGLYGTVWNGDWCDVGQPSSIATAERMLDV